MRNQWLRSENPGACGTKNPKGHLGPAPLIRETIIELWNGFPLSGCSCWGLVKYPGMELAFAQRNHRKRLNSSTSIVLEKLCGSKITNKNIQEPKGKSLGEKEDSGHRKRFKRVAKSEVNETPQLSVFGKWKSWNANR